MSEIDDRKSALVSALVSYSRMQNYMTQAHPHVTHDFSYSVIGSLCAIAHSIEQAEQRALTEGSDK